MTAAGLAAVAYLGAVDPGVGGHYPGCPWLALTGWYCPGCGGLRAVHALVHGDVAAAFGFNPLLVVLLPVAVLAYAGWARRSLAGSTRPQRSGPIPDVLRLALPLALLLLVAGFWVLRNLPAGAWAAP